MARRRLSAPTAGKNNWSGSVTSPPQLTAEQHGRAAAAAALRRALSAREAPCRFLWEATEIADYFGVAAETQRREVENRLEKHRLTGVMQKSIPTPEGRFLP